MNQTATLAGGCYWCFEAFYQRLKGIISVTSGYSGGHTDNPTAEKVYAGDTGHAECVQIVFDPKIISYRDLIEIFYVMHDPTTLNRQGNDVGDEYRSAIFYHDSAQNEIAEQMTKDFAPTLWHDPIVTQIVPFEKFWPADETMQDYYNRNPDNGYCQVVISPKLAKLRAKYAARLKSESTR
jgi:peptide-methionine (S)-S-oxide reductase